VVVRRGECSTWNAGAVGVSFGFRHSGLFRHSDFVVRHSPDRKNYLEVTRGTGAGGFASWRAWGNLWAVSKQPRGGDRGSAHKGGMSCASREDGGPVRRQRLLILGIVFGWQRWLRGREPQPRAPIPSPSPPGGQTGGAVGHRIRGARRPRHPETASPQSPASPSPAGIGGPDRPARLTAGHLPGCPVQRAGAGGSAARDQARSPSKCPGPGCGGILSVLYLPTGPSGSDQRFTLIYPTEMGVARGADAARQLDVGTREKPRARRRRDQWRWGMGRAFAWWMKRMRRHRMGGPPRLCWRRASVGESVELAALGRGMVAGDLFANHLYDYAAAEAAYALAAEAVEPGFTSKWRLMYARARALQQDGHGDAARGGLKLSWASSAPCAARRCSGARGMCWRSGIAGGSARRERDEHEESADDGSGRGAGRHGPDGGGGGRPAVHRGGSRNDHAFRERGTGKPFVAVGLNYFDPETGWAPKIWQQFDEAASASSSGWVAQQGFNTIRVFVTLTSSSRSRQADEGGGGQVPPADSSCAASARSTSFRPVPSCGKVRGLVQGDRFADDTLLDAEAGWWKEFAAAFRDESAILRTTWPTSRWWRGPARPCSPSGTAGSRIATAAWRGSRPPEVPARQGGSARPDPAPANQPARGDLKLLDYQRFREHIGGQWGKAYDRGDPLGGRSPHGSRGARAVGVGGHAAERYALLRVRFEARGQAGRFHHRSLLSARSAPALRRPEGVQVNAVYLQALLKDCSVGKPVLLGEFKLVRRRRPEGRLGLALPEKRWTPGGMVRQAAGGDAGGGTCGWLNWAFADTPTARDISRWSGCWTTDLKLKPWGQYSALGPRVGPQALPGRPFDRSVAETPFDRGPGPDRPGGGEGTSTGRS